MALLQVESVSVRFGGIMAVNDTSLTVEPGTVTGLIGPNGAGKTTLFNIVTGLQAPTRGRVRLDGRDITGVKPHRRARMGVARTFQRLEVFGSLTARENVLVATEMRQGWSHERFSPRDFADELLDRVGLSSVADAQVSSLPTGTARLVELARALATKPTVLLLDEPSSGLDESESDALGALCTEMAERNGLAVLLVEHDMPLVMGTCKYIYVLEYGQVIARGSAVEIQADPRVQSAYLGAPAEPTAAEPTAAVPTAAVPTARMGG